MGKLAVMAYGRMNPVTIGHRLLAEQVRSAAELHGGDPLLFLSHSYDGLKSSLRKTKIKNPLPYLDKLSYVREALGDLVEVRESSHRTVFDIVTELNGLGYNELIVVGDAAFISAPLPRYNGELFHFDRLEFMLSGIRDEQSDDFLETVSATRVRQAVVAGDFETFNRLVATRGSTAKLWKQLTSELKA